MSLSARVNQRLVTAESFSTDSGSSSTPRIDKPHSSAAQASPVDPSHQQQALQTFANAGKNVYTVA